MTSRGLGTWALQLWALYSLVAYAASLALTSTHYDRAFDHLSRTYVNRGMLEGVIVVVASAALLWKARSLVRLFVPPRDDAVSSGGVFDTALVCTGVTIFVITMGRLAGLLVFPVGEWVQREFLESGAELRWDLGAVLAALLAIVTPRLIAVMKLQRESGAAQ